MNRKALGLPIQEGADLTATINFALVSGVLEDKETSFVAFLDKAGRFDMLPEPGFKH
jgi:hypothetical protein